MPVDKVYLLLEQFNEEVETVMSNMTVLNGMRQSRFSNHRPLLGKLI